MKDVFLPPKMIRSKQTLAVFNSAQKLYPLPSKQVRNPILSVQVSLCNNFYFNYPIIARKLSRGVQVYDIKF